MSSTQPASFDSLEKAAEHLAERAVVGLVARQMNKEALDWGEVGDTLKGLGTSAVDTVKNNPLPFAGAGIGALLGGGSALLNKNKRKHALRNTLAGGLTGGVTGLAGQLALRGYQGQPLTGEIPQAAPGAAPSIQKRVLNLTKDPQKRLNEILTEAERVRDQFDLGNLSVTGAGAVGAGGFTANEVRRLQQNPWSNRSLLGRITGRESGAALTAQKNLQTGLDTAATKAGPSQDLYKHLAAQARGDMKGFQRSIAPLQKADPGILGRLSRIVRGPNPERFMTVPVNGKPHRLTAGSLQQLVREGAAANTPQGLLRGGLSRTGNFAKGIGGRAGVAALPAALMWLLNNRMDDARAARYLQQVQ